MRKNSSELLHIEWCCVKKKLLMDQYSHCMLGRVRGLGMVGLTGTDFNILKETLPALVRDLFTFSSKVIKRFIIV
jgi:hypothetical protein